MYVTYCLCLRTHHLEFVVSVLGVVWIGLGGAYGQSWWCVMWGVQEVVRLFVRMGFRSKRMQRDTISKVASIYFDRDDASLTKGVRLQVRIIVPALRSDLAHAVGFASATA